MHVECYLKPRSLICFLFQGPAGGVAARQLEWVDARRVLPAPARHSIPYCPWCRGRPEAWLRGSWKRWTHAECFLPQLRDSIPYCPWCRGRPEAWLRGSWNQWTHAECFLPQLRDAIPYCPWCRGRPEAWLRGSWNRWTHAECFLPQLMRPLVRGTTGFRTASVQASAGFTCAASACAPS